MTAIPNGLDPADGYKEADASTVAPDLDGDYPEDPIPAINT